MMDAQPRRPLLIAHLIAAMLLTACALADELCLTGNALGNRNLPVAFTVQPGQANLLFDGSHLDKQSVAWPQDGAIEIQFAEPVRVSRVEMVVYNDRQRSYNAAQRMRLEVCRESNVVEKGDWVSLDADGILQMDEDGAVVWGSQSTATLPGKASGDSLNLTVEKRPGAHQCLLRELIVWGIPERLASIEAACLIPFVAKDNTYSSIGVSWESVPDCRYVRVRYRAKGEPGWNSACFTGSTGVIGWLEPGVEYELAAEAVGASPVETAPETVVVRLPGPLEVRTMGDLWGMNFYPNGGGAHERHDDEPGNTREMLKLLEAAGVRHVRWYVASPTGSRLFAQSGLSLFPFATYDDPEGYRRLAGEYGIWLAATDNEPDYANTLAEDFVARFIPRKRAAEQFDARMLLAGPAVGGEMVGPGTDYLADCYRAGLKDALHALDLHPYTKVSTPTPPGGNLGGPEGVLYSIGACRELMGQVGDAERPLIVSEAGHPTHEGFWWMPPSSVEQQARYVVRTHLLLAAAGMRRIFWYAFQDEGTDPKNPEHNFGIVDWHGRPKPAYDSYCTMTRLLSDTVCEGFVEGLTAPAYGVRCAADDGYITALWDCGGEGEIRVAAGCGLRSITGLTAQEVRVPEASEAQIVLPVSEDVRYVFSARPLSVISQRRITPPVEPRIDMKLEPSTVRVKPGQTARWNVLLSSEFDCDAQLTVGTANPWGGEKPEKLLALPARGKAEVELSMAVPDATKPGIISWDTRCQFRPEDGQWHDGDFRRALFIIVQGD